MPYLRRSNIKNMLYKAFFIGTVCLIDASLYAGRIEPSAKIELTAAEKELYGTIAKFLLSEKMLVGFALGNKLQQQATQLDTTIQEEGIGAPLKKYLGPEGYKHYTENLNPENKAVLKEAVMQLYIDNELGRKTKGKELFEESQKILKIDQHEIKKLYEEYYGQDAVGKYNNEQIGQNFVNTILYREQEATEEKIRLRKKPLLPNAIFLNKKHAIQVLQTTLEDATREKSAVTKTVERFAKNETPALLKAQERINQAYAPFAQKLAGALAKVQSNQQPFDATDFPLTSDAIALGKTLKEHAALYTMNMSNETLDQELARIEYNWRNTKELSLRDNALALAIIDAKQAPQPAAGAFSEPLFVLPVNLILKNNPLYHPDALFSDIIEIIAKEKAASFPGAMEACRAKLKRLAEIAKGSSNAKN